MSWSRWSYRAGLVNGNRQLFYQRVLHWTVLQLQQNHRQHTILNDLGHTGQGFDQITRLHFRLDRVIPDIKVIITDGIDRSVPCLAKPSQASSVCSRTSMSQGTHCSTSMITIQQAPGRFRTLRSDKTLQPDIGKPGNRPRSRCKIPGLSAYTVSLCARRNAFGCPVSGLSPTQVLFSCILHMLR